MQEGQATDEVISFQNGFANRLADGYDFVLQSTIELSAVCLKIILRIVYITKIQLLAPEPTPPFLKIAKTAAAGNEDSKRLESIYAKNIVIVIIAIICLISSKLKYDETNDDPPNRTSPDVFDIAVQSLVQNSAPVIFYDFLIRIKLD